jgi:hypothetical protein
MAVIRCSDHPPKGRTKNYVRQIEPVGHPNSGLVCGGKYCENAGLICLEEEEATAYDKGQRVFEALVSSAMKMRAK